MRGHGRLGWDWSFFLPTNVWEDDRYQFTGQQIDTSAGRIDYDYDDIGVGFQSNARYPEEKIVFPAQMPHAVKTGHIVKPHIHWIQNQAAIPNIMMEYRIVQNGTVMGAFSQAAFDAVIFPYTSGKLLQIITFPDLDMSAVTSVSAFIDTKIYRDSANASGLFAGADPVGTTVVLKEYDNHVYKNSIGSREVFEK